LSHFFNNNRNLFKSYTARTTTKSKKITQLPKK